MKKTIATLSVLLSLALAPSASAAFGDGFSFAEVTDPDSGTTAPAFPGEQAFWAGVCDLQAEEFAVGSDPGLPFGSCIEHPAAGLAFGDDMAPPLSPGLEIPGFPDGWVRSTGETGGPSWRLADVEQAGARPEGTASFWFSRGERGGGLLGESFGVSDGAPRSVRVSLPPGVIANPNAVPKCPSEALVNAPTSCPPNTQVGVSTISLDGIVATHPVYNVEPRRGKVAELVISGVGLSKSYTVNQPIVAALRSDGDFGADGFAEEISAAAPLIAQTITLWGVPWAASHDRYRPVSDYCAGGVGGSDFSGGNSNLGGGGAMPVAGLSGGFRGSCSQEPQSYQPSWGPIKPFFATQTECSVANPVTKAVASNWNTPVLAKADSPAPLVSGCEDLTFPADLDLATTSVAADSPSGLDVELTIPQNNDPPSSVAANPSEANGAPAYWRTKAGLAVSHLKDTVVTLPEGFSINPSAANGQGVCTSEQIGLTSGIGQKPIRFDNDDPHDGVGSECPESAKVATVTVETPLLEEADWPTGEVYLAAQGDNPFASNYAIYILLRSPERGLVIKLAGKVEPDPATGRLKTTFADNPQLPFDRFELHFKGGPTAPLATAPVCGPAKATSTLTPYSAPGSPVLIEQDLQVSQEPNGAASCPTSKSARPLGVSFEAGTTGLLAGHHSPFTLRLRRPDGHQEIKRIELSTPEGLLAKLAGVPYCPEQGIAQAIGRSASGDGALERANPSCPAQSQVGTTTIGVGAGNAPFYATGKVYLTGPYKGAPISLAFLVPAVAGPFDLGVQVVRTALHVNPKTAQVSAVSDEIPEILAGVPLRIRDIRVDVDRPGFILNPTDCSEQTLSGKVTGASGAVANVSNRFQVAECAQLPFKPKIALKLKGATKRASYQGLIAVVTARPGDANIASASVRMPRSAFLAQEHIRTVCTRVQFAAEVCPPGSIYGKATALTPLLDYPLSGPVYLRSSDNNLPDLVPALKGPAEQPIEVELAGRTDSVKGALRNTFDVVPDAPLTKFTLELFGAKKGLIVNSQDLCQKRHRATVSLTAQNGRVHNFRPVVKNACGKLKRAKKGRKGAKGKGRGKAAR